ncbi:hypothetical protein OKW24_000025 [Peribacillus simplex]|nr:hypothetical protein [Peribacillus simplex]MDF9758252.1 hypothetical protein [Peribacillus simplex]
MSSARFNLPALCTALSILSKYYIEAIAANEEIRGKLRWYHHGNQSSYRL